MGSSPEACNARDRIQLPDFRGRCCCSRWSAALVMAATLALWAYYGTAVFFEMVRAGWVACF